MRVLGKLYLAGMCLYCSLVLFAFMIAGYFNETTPWYVKVFFFPVIGFFGVVCFLSCVGFVFDLFRKRPSKTRTRLEGFRVERIPEGKGYGESR